MRTKNLIRGFVVPAAATAAVVLGAPAAFASGMSYTVAVGGSTAAGMHNVTADNTTGVTFQVNDAGAVRTMTCTDVHFPGTGAPATDAYVNSGSGIVDIADLASSTWNGCLFAGQPLTVEQIGTWVLNGDGAANVGATDVISGHVHAIQAHVVDTATGGLLCDFTVSGTAGNNDGRADGTYNEASKVLSVNETDYTGNLRVWNVSGCFNQLTDGDPADFVGDFDVNSPDGTIDIRP